MSSSSVMFHLLCLGPRLGQTQRVRCCLQGSLGVTLEPVSARVPGQGHPTQKRPRGLTSCLAALRDGLFVNSVPRVQSAPGGKLSIQTLLLNPRHPHIPVPTIHPLAALSPSQKRVFLALLSTLHLRPFPHYGPLLLFHFSSSYAQITLLTHSIGKAI